MNETAVATENVTGLPPRGSYLALALVSCAILMFEIVLTRIFSVTMWYHYAFLAISLAMFGMTAGALIVWWTPQGDALTRLAKWSQRFSLAILISFFYHAYLPTNPLIATHPLQRFIYLLLLYLVFSVPFIFGGICVCIALTRYPARVGRLYAADLLGASAGCLLVIYVLDCTDGPSTVVFSALLAGAGALLFTVATQPKRNPTWVAMYCCGLTALFLLSAISTYRNHPLLRIGWVKGAAESDLLYQKWNSFSRITVSGDLLAAAPPAGWFLSRAYTNREPVRQLHLQIDSAAGTVLTEFNGQPSQIEHLKYDLINLVHYLRSQAKVLVIGVGGGRDVLSALAFRQASVTGIEINQDILTAVNEVFGGYTGHLSMIPQVRFVNDEARSYIARSSETYDIIQASLIDTCAASAAGAFVLAEHSLYTTEAWANFLEHLTPRGILTFSRWYTANGKITPEIYRTVSLARAALLRVGVKDPSQHVVVVKPSENYVNTVATILVSRSPFSPEDLNVLGQTCQRLQYIVMLGPGYARYPIWEQLINGQPPSVPEFAADSIDLRAPTDDKPFFFWTAKPSQLINRGLLTLSPAPESILVLALVLVFGLSAVCFLGPFLILYRRLRNRPIFSLSMFFLSIGCGFMLIEISQMQRLIIFLGHPTYGLSVVLFSLLVSSGVGSYLADRLNPDKWRTLFMGLLGAVSLVGILSPILCRQFESQAWGIRFALTVVLMGPAGLAMGFPFPLGMRKATRLAPSATPWLWGMNGAASVCTSIVGVLISLLWGISTTYWVGLAAYVVAFLAWVQIPAVLVPEKMRTP